MFTKFDKAFAAALGGWLAIGAVMLIEHAFDADIPGEVEAYVTTLVVGVLTWLVPNRVA